MEFLHKPIMVEEIINALEIKKDGIYVDCTVGGGGHSLAIAKKLGPKGRLFCFDRDSDAIAKSTQTLLPHKDKVTMVKSNFKESPRILKEEFGIEKIDGFLIDLGISSYQIDEGKRGFSFVREGDLDMRMDREEEIENAQDIINTYSVQELTKIFRDFGEEEFAWQIAKNIVKSREQKQIQTTFELREIIENSMPKKIVFSRKGASKKVFQALRIFINEELEELDTLLKNLVSLLGSGGRGCVLTFHSLEDRIVKNVFKEESTACICPPKIPICICKHKASVKLVNKKPITASEDETKENSRSTSAKLRIVEKI